MRVCLLTQCRIKTSTHALSKKEAKLVIIVITRTHNPDKKHLDQQSIITPIAASPHLHQPFSISINIHTHQVRKRSN